MKRVFYNLAIFILVINGFANAQSKLVKPAIKLNINWANYLSQQDLLWDEVPKDYFAGAFVGNGLLGTILFKDDIDTTALRF